MTRGKHGQAAAVRHEVQSRDAEIGTYQNAVARLTAENRELKANAEKQRQSAARTERELRGRLDAAASPKIDAMKLQLVEQSRKLREARDALETITRQRSNLATQFARHLVKDLNFTYGDALRFIGDTIGQYVLGDLESDALRTSDSDEEFQRARAFDAVLERKKSANVQTAFKGQV